jgi:hypothetical protein
MTYGLGVARCRQGVPESTFATVRHRMSAMGRSVTGSTISRALYRPTEHATAHPLHPVEGVGVFRSALSVSGTAIFRIPNTDTKLINDSPATYRAIAVEER